MHFGIRNATSPIVVDLPLSGSALLMFKMGLCVAISSCTQLNMIQSAITRAPSSLMTTWRWMRLMMSRSNESPSTGSGHGSTIQWP